MKANAPKRKIFDAVDMMTADEAKTESGNGLQYLPLDAGRHGSEHTGAWSFESGDRPETGRWV